MATKSDFAQKLLHDLRVRKEKMASAQTTSRQSTQTSRGDHEEEGTEPYNLSYHASKQILASASFLHATEQDYEVPRKNKLVLNCAYEIMRRKARRHENIRNCPFAKTGMSCTKIRSLDDLIKHVCKDLEMVKFYGGYASDECDDVAARLHIMLEKDIYNKDADVNSMWDFEWSHIMLLIHEEEDIARDVERYVLNGLLDEITNDLMVSLEVSV